MYQQFSLILFLGEGVNFLQLPVMCSYWSVQMVSMTEYISIHFNSLQLNSFQLVFCV